MVNLNHFEIATCLALEKFQRALHVGADIVIDNKHGEVGQARQAANSSLVAR